MARFPITLFVFVTLLALFAAPALGDRIELTTGARLTGKIVEEDRYEVTFELEDGMRMRIPKSRIVRIERGEVEATPEKPPDRPTFIPPSTTPEPPPPPARTAGPADPDLCGPGPFHDWFNRYARAPVLRASRTTRFRAYTYVSHEPLRAEGKDEEIAAVAREHGLGGYLASWRLKYDGSRDLQFGDEVKFVSELTFPLGSRLPLLTLEEGPLNHADRLLVILVRRDHKVRRYFTPAIFSTADFKGADLRAVEKKALAVRTYTPGYEPLKTAWLTPTESEFLEELDSPYGESIQVRLERCRFRVKWFGTAPQKRPALDPALLARNHPEPLAARGVEGASEAEVMGRWGTPEKCLAELERIQTEVRGYLIRIGVKPGEGCYVERDRVGNLGAKGIGLEVQRFWFPAHLLESVTR